MFNLCTSFIYVYNQDCVKKETEPKEVSGKVLSGKPCCGAERTESSKGEWGISKIYEEKEKEEDKGEGMEGERKGEETETIITSVDVEDGVSVI